MEVRSWWPWWVGMELSCTLEVPCFGSDMNVPVRDSAPGSATMPLDDGKQMSCPPWPQFSHLCNEAVSLV